MSGLKTGASGHVSEAAAEKVYIAERQVAAVRVAVIAFNVFVYYVLLDRARAIAWLADLIVVVALVYCLVVFFLEPYRRFPLLLSSYFTSVADASLIVLWLLSTGGIDSPFYVLWYASIAAVAFRYDLRATIFAVVLYAICYVGLVAGLGQLPGHLTEVVVRTGYIFFVGTVGGLLSQMQLRRSETLLAVSEAVNSTLDLTETMRRVARETARALGADMVGAFLADPDQQYLRPIAGYHVPQHLIAPFMKFPIPLKGNRALEEAWAHHRPIYSSDAEADPRIDRETIERFPQRSVLFVPMVVKGEPIGGLFCTWWEEQHDFTFEELRLVEGISRQAALAIDNARLFASQREEAEISEALLTLVAAVGSRQDLDEVLETVVQIAPQLLGLRRCGLFLLAPREGILIPTKAWGLAEELRPTFLALKGPPTIPAVSKAIQSQAPVVVEEASLDTEVPRKVASALDIRSMLIIPLLSSGKVMGTMAVDTPGEPHVFTQRQIAIARGIATHAAVAIDNARLFGELRVALGELAASQQRIVQTERLRALGEMAGGVAHDFNNSLAVVLGRIHLLLNQVEDPALRRQLRVMEQAALDGARTVQRVQEFARRRPARPFEAVDLNQEVKEVVEVTRARWKDEAQLNGIRYDVRMEPAPLPPVAGDPSELREALTNLVLNALDAMPQGGQLTFRTGITGERVYCVVADTGVGMPDEVKRRVFEPFFTTKVEKGSGLGLSVAYGIVARHGGEIEVQSQVGQGSAFTVWFPVGRGIHESRPSAPVARPYRSANILVIDDDPEVREVLVELLAGQGHTVAACADGASGLARFQAERFDLVITDLGMPGLSGWEVARRVKARSPETPVAFVTGWAHTIDPDEARAKGVDFLVAKPFGLEDMTSLLAQALL